VCVLSLSANPAQDWADLRQATLDRLKEENAALLQCLSALETSGTQGTPCHRHRGRQVQHDDRASPTRELGCHLPGNAQLEDELREKEKRMLRLRQVFAAKTAEFREVLSAILSVKVAFYDNGQVRVASQYGLGAAFVCERRSSHDNNFMQAVTSPVPVVLATLPASQSQTTSIDEGEA